MRFLRRHLTTSRIAVNRPALRDLRQRLALRSFNSGRAAWGFAVDQVFRSPGVEAERLVPDDLEGDTADCRVRPPPASTEAPPPPDRTSKAALVVFGAEQGFAGAFNERVLETIADEVLVPVLFLIGTRGLSHAVERGIAADWTSAMPSHSSGIPKLASDICDAFYQRIGTGGVERVTAVFANGSVGAEPTVVRRLLLPPDPATFAGAEHREPPILNLPARKLLADLTAQYLHALFCEIALHAFAAENQARMTAMAAAHREIDRQLGALRATFRHVRQEQITAEIIELAGGAAASQGRPGV
ncbi:F0F1 ATP synthase subunit gamma [Aurantimonas sp. A3-2-R12]|uniref:F0F1 ATP synthase subunit gamma n=1 Tax=Aurantimonas sp. A3-2-R12 TaxID=3114362 RepID=UPI002E195FFF|nr:FoF1 ATP synthase subunit gamma [Aurantimonas sp. A3-2-R12]